MELNLVDFCSIIKKVNPRCPITPLTPSTMIFRGERLEIVGEEAKTYRYRFRFNSLESFIGGLKDIGLMLNHREFEQIIKEYYGRGKNNQSQ